MFLPPYLINSWERQKIKSNLLSHPKLRFRIQKQKAESLDFFFR